MMLNAHEDLVVEVVHVRGDAASNEHLNDWGKRGCCVEKEEKEGMRSELTRLPM